MGSPETVRHARALREAETTRWTGTPRAGDVLERADGGTCLVSISIPAGWVFAGLADQPHQGEFPPKPKSGKEEAAIVRAWRNGRIVWEAANG